MLSATFQDETAISLAWAIRSGTWHPFARLELDGPATDGDDVALSFDPVEHPLPGLETYEWIRRLREPAYATARRSRRS